MKTIEFNNENKMNMETGLKIFDNQTNLITTGSVFANTQKSMFIRSFNTVETYNGYTHPEGHLQDFDLSYFKEDMPEGIVYQIRKLAKERDVYVYEFFHTSSRKAKTIHGYVVTTKDHEFLEYFVTGNIKSYFVIQECAEYVSDYNAKNYARERMVMV